MVFTNLKKAKAHFSEYVNNLEKTGPVIVTKRGVPRAAIIELTEDQVDSFIIRHSESIHKEALKAIKEIENGETYSVDEALEMIEKLRANDKKHQAHQKRG